MLLMCILSSYLQEKTTIRIILGVKLIYLSNISILFQMCLTFIFEMPGDIFSKRGRMSQGDLFIDPIFFLLY